MSKYSATIAPPCGSERRRSALGASRYTRQFEGCDVESGARRFECRVGLGAPALDVRVLLGESEFGVRAGDAREVRAAHRDLPAACTIRCAGSHAVALLESGESYDEDLVTCALAFARQHEAALILPPDRPLALVEGFAYPGCGFDMLAAVGPGVHKYHDKDDPVHQATRAVFPAYRCEFSGTESEDEVAYRYSRAAGVTPTRLAREPRPTMKIRYRPDDASAMDERIYFTPNSLQYQFPKLEDRPDRFVEFENYQNRVWRVEWDDAFTVVELTGKSDERDERRGLGLEELLEFAKTVLYGPNLGAGTSEFTKLD